MRAGLKVSSDEADEDGNDDSEELHDDGCWEEKIENVGVCAWLLVEGACVMRVR